LKNVNERRNEKTEIEDMRFLRAVTGNRMMYNKCNKDIIDGTEITDINRKRKKTVERNG
jgi:hypothetical protein